MSEFGNHSRSDRGREGADDRNPSGGARRGCTFARADLKAYLDGEIGVVRQGVVRWHLARCPECREETAWLTRLGEDMKDLEQATPRPELRTRILASLPDGPPSRTADRPAPRVVRARQVTYSLRWGAVGFAAFGAIAALAGVGVFTVNRMTARTAPPKVAVGLSRPQREALPRGSEPAGPQAPAQIARTPQRIVAPGPRKDPFQPGDAKAVDTRASSSVPDRTFDEANRLFEKRWAEEQQQERAHYREVLRSAGISGAAAARKDAGPVRLALAVTDVRAAREHLQAMAQAFRTPTAGTAPTAAPAQSEDGSSGTRKPGSAHEVVALDVPAGSVAPFMRNLEQIGSLGVYTSSSGNAEFNRTLAPGLRIRTARPIAVPAVPVSSGTGSGPKPIDGEKRVRITVELVPAPSGH